MQPTFTAILKIINNPYTYVPASGQGIDVPTCIPNDMTFGQPAFDADRRSD